MIVNDIVLSKLKLSTITPDISIAIIEIETKIRNFCNIPADEQLPAELTFTHANMVVDLVKNESNSIENQNIKSISMGETSYTFDTSSKDKIAKLILNYESDLKKFRRLKKGWL